MDSQVIASVNAVLGTLCGAFVTVWVQRETKKVAELENLIKRYKAEIHARQDEEEAAILWLVALGQADTSFSAKLMLRNRAEKIRGLRPSIGPAEVQEKGD